jgi:hypothetical protein
VSAPNGSEIRCIAQRTLAKSRALAPASLVSGGPRPPRPRARPRPHNRAPPTMVGRREDFWPFLGPKTRFSNTLLHHRPSVNNHPMSQNHPKIILAHSLAQDLSTKQTLTTKATPLHCCAMPHDLTFCTGFYQADTIVRARALLQACTAPNLHTKALHQCGTPCCTATHTIPLQASVATTCVPRCLLITWKAKRKCMSRVHVGCTRLSSAHATGIRRGPVQSLLPTAHLL